MTIPVGAPYHFRGTAKMVWGRSINVPTKKNLRFLGGSWVAQLLQQ